MGKIIRAILADDDADQRKILKYYLKKYPEIKIVSEVSEGDRVLQHVKRFYPDVLFLDVELPGKSGIEVARQLSREDFHPLIVFFTSYPQYAVEGFEVEAVDYLVKPVEPARLEKAIQRIMAELADHIPAASAPQPIETLQFLSIMFNDHARVVSVDDIVFFSVESGTVYVHLKKFSGPLRYRSIKRLEAELDPKRFVRVHRKYLVNVAHVREIVNWFKHSYHIIMDDEKQTELPLSRRGARELRKLIRW